MTRVLLNPTFDIETGALLSHDGVFQVEHIPIRCDRGAVNQAKTAGSTAGTAAANSGTEATQDRASVIPGLMRQANNPTGFTPVEKNNMLVASQQGAGGANAALTGEGELSALRSRTAGGYAPALAEAARAKTRQLSTNALGVSNADAQLAHENQARAQQQLLGLYGTDTSNMMKEMGLQNQDLESQLAAGRQGWLQNTEGVLNTVGNLGKDAASAAKMFA